MKTDPHILSDDLALPDEGGRRWLPDGDRTWSLKLSKGGGVAFHCNGVEQSVVDARTAFDALGVHEANLRNEARRVWFANGVAIWSTSRFPGIVAPLLKSEPTLWLALARWNEAATFVAAERAREGDATAQAWLPLFQRTRFLLLTADVRGQTSVDRQSFFDNTDDSLRHEFAFRRLTARDEWARALLEHEEHPALRAWDSKTLEREGSRLLWSGEGLLCLEAEPDEQTSSRSLSISPGDGAFAAWFAREFLLRRFMLREVLRVAWPLIRSRRRGGLAAGLLALGVAILGVVFVGFLVQVAGDPIPFGGLRWAALTGAIVYLTLGAAVVVGGEEASYPLCLRLAAASALGTVGLLSLGRSWLLATGGVWWTVAVLLGAAFGYLTLEARAHGPSPRQAVARAFWVFVAGVMHAIPVALISLWVFHSVLFPYDVNHPLQASQLTHAVALSAATGLTFGVFLQMLWEDTPVTFPLAHLRWRRER